MQEQNTGIDPNSALPAKTVSYIINEISRVTNKPSFQDITNWDAIKSVEYLRASGVRRLTALIPGFYNPERNPDYTYAPVFPDILSGEIQDRLRQSALFLQEKITQDESVLVADEPISVGIARALPWMVKEHLHDNNQYSNDVANAPAHIYRLGYENWLCCPTHERLSAENKKLNLAGFRLSLLIPEFYYLDRLNTGWVALKFNAPVVPDANSKLFLERMRSYVATNLSSN